MFLPENLMKGGLHTVNPQAENDGLLNTYFLYSGDNVFEVTTGIALRIRIRELYAIDKLRGMSKTDEFTKALKAAGKQKVESVAGLVKDPVGTIKRVPQGASRFFGRIGEGMKGGKSEEEGKRPARPHRRAKSEGRPRGQARSQSLFDQSGTAGAAHECRTRDGWRWACRQRRADADRCGEYGSQYEPDPATNAREFDARGFAQL